MQLTRLSVERYKCFRDREELEIRPLTILIGRNSSGKSVVARLPMLLAHALSSRATAPVDLVVGDLDFGASFVDLVHGRSKHGSIGLGFEVADGQDAITAWLEVQHIDEQKLQVVNKLAVTSQCSGSVRLEWTGEGEPAQPRYRDAEGGEHQLAFSGFRARGLPESAIDEALTALTRRARGAFQGARYLGPFRAMPQRDYRYPGGALRDVGAGGVHAPAVLGADLLRNGGALLADVGRFYQEHLGGRLDVEGGKDTFSLVMQREERGRSVAINLVDAGVGLSQVLPLIVQRYVDATDPDSGFLEIVEQPELHLHPGAHAAVAELYIDAVTARPNARFIIETHAEIILLRIRRRIAEGRLDPDQVAVYWLRDDPDAERLVTRIPIGRDGGVEVWPKGVFSEDFAEVQAIERARKATGE